MAEPELPRAQTECAAPCRQRCGAAAGAAVNGWRRRAPEGGSLRLKMLPHRVVPRACPVLSPSELRGVLRGEAKLKGKARYWRGLLESAVALHCFPPGGDPLPGEKRFVFMGHPKHTQAEVNFARRQGLWRVDDERGGGVR